MPEFRERLGRARRLDGNRARIPVGKLFVVEPKKVQDGGVQVMNACRFFDRLEAEIIGGAVSGAAADAAAGEPDGEAIMIVIATGAALGDRRSTKFAAPNHECVFQHASLLEIREQGGDRLVDLGGVLPEVRLDVGVMIPRLTCAMPKLHVAYARSSSRRAIKVCRPCTLSPYMFMMYSGSLADFERFGCRHLHAEGKLERLDARALIERPGGRTMFGIELAQKLQLLLLHLMRGMRTADVFDQPVDLAVLRIDERPLKCPGREAGLPIRLVGNRVTARAHCNETREVLIFGPKPVQDPRADARSRLYRIAAVHQQQRRFMVGNLSIHRANNGNVVYMSCSARKQLAHLEAAAAVLLKFKWRRQCAAGFAFGRVRLRKRLAGIFLQQRLAVERIDVRRPAVQRKSARLVLPVRSNVAASRRADFSPGCHALDAACSCRRPRTRRPERACPTRSRLI